MKVKVKRSAQNCVKLNFFYIFLDLLIMINLLRELNDLVVILACYALREHFFGASQCKTIVSPTR